MFLFRLATRTRTASILVCSVASLLGVIDTPREKIKIKIKKSKGKEKQTRKKDRGNQKGHWKGPGAPKSFTLC